MANTLSLLVRQQLPEYIRSDYDTFVTFVEAYYEWMDLPGNAMQVSKSLPAHMDLDTSIQTFIDYYTKQFLPLFPAELLARPEFLIQHAKEFYRTKGTVKAFKLLFRLLYNQDIEVFFPKESILKASDGQWVTDTSLRLDPTIWTLQYGDGVTTRFRALLNMMEVPIHAVYLNGVLQVSGYNFSPNEPWITFTTAPAANVEIKVTYLGSQLIGQFTLNAIVLKLVGLTSGASAISETLQELVDSTVTQLDLRVSSPRGAFTQSEIIHGNWIYGETGQESINIYARLISYVASIQVIDGGLNYNVGDPVVITGGFPNATAEAIIESVYRAVISNIVTIRGGAGYQVGQPVYITSTPNTGLSIVVSSVDASGIVHPNSYPISQDVMSLWANTVMSNSDYYFNSSITENVNTIMSQAFTTVAFGGTGPGPEQLGPITGLAIISSTTVFTTAPTLKIDAPILLVTGNTANGNVATANVSLSYFGTLGRMNVVQGGIGYRIGDEVSFENIPGIGIGVGGAAEVTALHVANSGIKTIEFRPSRLTGTVNVNHLMSNTEVVGTGTYFTTELRVNDRIEINSESRYVSSIANNQYFYTNAAFTRTSTKRNLGIYGRYMVGGINYRQSHLPLVRVNSANLSAWGANAQVDTILSGGESLFPVAEFPPGKIISIRVTNPGYGYAAAPELDLTGSGDGTATAIAIMLRNLFTAPGRYLSTQGFLSADRKLQGSDYYTTFAYVIRSQTELVKYKTVLKDLLHPAGMRAWAEYVIDGVVTAPISVEANIANTYQTTA